MQLGHRVGLKRPIRDVIEMLALELNCNAVLVSQSPSPPLLDDAVPRNPPKV